MRTVINALNLSDRILTDFGLWLLEGSECFTSTVGKRRRFNNVVDIQTTFLQRQNDVVCLQGGTMGHDPPR